MTMNAHPSARRHQAGLTLVELLVAMALGLLIAGAAVATLVIGRQGFNAVDSSTQLRENARFAAGLIQRIGIQAGYENNAGGNFTQWRLFCGTPGATLACGAPNPANPAVVDTNPGVRAYDNAMITNLALLPGGLAHGSRGAACAVPDTSCQNGSDILMIRYFGDTRPGAAVGNGSMINCAGMNEPENPAPAYSIFHVVRSASGEPTLVCAFFNPNTLAWQQVPLVEGVEGFQLLFGVDGVSPGAAPPVLQLPVNINNVGNDTVPERYLRASELDVAGNPAATADNWRRVRSIRVGLVVRGGANSAVDRASSGRTIDVLGNGFFNAADVGSRLVVPADGRLRQTLVFTIHLRNPQYVFPNS